MSECRACLCHNVSAEGSPPAQRRRRVRPCRRFVFRFVLRGHRRHQTRSPRIVTLPWSAASRRPALTMSPDGNTQTRGDSSRKIPDRPRFQSHWRNVMRKPEVSLSQHVCVDFSEWLMCSSQMKQCAEWYDTCLAVTHVFAANGYWCWWAPLYSGSQAQLFWSLVLLFLSPLFPVFCLLATSNQSLEMEAEPSGTSLLSIRSWDEMKVIMGTRQPCEHLTSQEESEMQDFLLGKKINCRPYIVWKQNWIEMDHTSS